jgi:hypothetical protein
MEGLPMNATSVSLRVAAGERVRLNVYPDAVQLVIDSGIYLYPEGLAVTDGLDVLDELADRIKAEVSRCRSEIVDAQAKAEHPAGKGSVAA